MTDSSVGRGFGMAFGAILAVATLGVVIELGSLVVDGVRYRGGVDPTTFGGTMGSAATSTDLEATFLEARSDGSTTYWLYRTKIGVIKMPDRRVHQKDQIRWYPDRGIGRWVAK